MKTHSVARCTRIAAALMLLVHLSSASAEDAVVVIGSDGRSPVTRQGQIIDYTGTELRLKTAAGRDESIPAARVVEIKTNWAADYLRALELRKDGKLAEAIRACQEAKASESRAWARRQIMAELTTCLAESGRFDQAGDEFLAMIASDPNTRHLAVMPLAWRPFPPDAALESRATAWLALGKNSPAAVVIGASWLLSTGRRADAIAALEQISLLRGAGNDERLARLADVQLWRTRLVTAKAEEVGRWKRAVVAMPAEVQACGWFVVGDAFSRLKQAEDSALAYLQVPLVHGQQRVMAADALVAAGKQLEALNRADQAAGLYREVLTDYATCPGAREAASRLAAMETGKH